MISMAASMFGTFKCDELNAALHKDNPNYARVIRSDLRKVVAILQNSGAMPHLG
jgi:hypothetical protein